MPHLYKLLQMVFQYTTLLGIMTFLFMVGVVQALIPSSQVFTHFP